MLCPCKFKGDTLGCITWLCCLTGSLIFGVILFSTTPLLETPRWVEDKCTTIAHDDRCLGQQLTLDCRVSVDVTLLSEPNCSLDVMPCIDCAAWKPKTMSVQRCVYRTATIYSDELTGQGSLQWLKVHPVDTTEPCFFSVANSSKVLFELPHEMEMTTGDVLMAVLPALFFWVSAGFVLPAYMEPNSYQGRTLAKLGIFKTTQDFELRGGHVETFSIPGRDERDDVALVTKSQAFDVPSNIVMTRRHEDEQSMEDGSHPRTSRESSRRGSSGDIMGQSKLKEPPDIGP